MQIYQDLDSFIDSLSTGELVVIMPSGANQLNNFCDDKGLSIPHQSNKQAYINEVNEIDKETRSDLRRLLFIDVSQEDNQALENAFTDYLDSFIPELREVA